MEDREEKEIKVGIEYNSDSLLGVDIKELYEWLGFIINAGATKIDIHEYRKGFGNVVDYVEFEGYYTRKETDFEMQERLNRRSEYEKQQQKEIEETEREQLRKLKDKYEPTNNSQ